MHRKIFILLFLIAFTSVGYSQSEKINIKTQHLQEANYLRMDDFYVTHYLYIDLFLRENLFPEATHEDVSAVLDAMKKYVSVETPLDIEIEKPGERNYLIRFAILQKNGVELLIAFTNWSVKKRVFEKEIKIENDSYTRWYFLNGDKMTYRKDMSDKNDYSSMSQTDLANAYLFDELTENDAKIKSTIDNALKEDGISVSDKIMTHLILLKYHIFKRDNKSVTEQTQFLDLLFEENATDSDLGFLRMMYDATKFQIELMK